MMKKHVLAAFALIAISAPAFSQVKVRPGFRAGFNASTVTNIDNSSRKIGFDGAAFVNVHFTRFYELQVETGFANQGFSQKGNLYYYDPNQDYIIPESRRDLNLKYLTLGVANKFFVAPGTGFHFIAGPGIDILVSNNRSGLLSPVDLSFFGGVGYEFPAGLGVEVRYKHGIIDIRDDYYDRRSRYDYSMMNSLLQVSLFYKFNF